MSTSNPETPAAERTAGRYTGKFMKKPPKKKRRIWLWILLSLAVVLLGVAATGVIMYKVGEKNMLPDNVVINVPEQQKEIIVPKEEGMITYQGRDYRRNDKITTILFMGVDRDEMTEVNEYGYAGHADVILLIAMDTATGKTTMINFPRDTYAEVDRYSINGSFITTEFKQLCLAFANGDGKEISCENQVRTVERFLYGIPIQSYLAIDMEGVLAVNEAVGGVTVTCLEDMKFPVVGYKTEGTEVTLHGKDAETYIRTREHGHKEVNIGRMARQKQYMQCFLNQVIAQSRSDLTLPVQLFQTMNRYMVTGLSVSDVTFLSTTFLQTGADFEFASLAYTIDDSTGTIYYYLDQDALLQTIVDVFFTPVE